MIYVQVLMSVLICAIIYAVCTEILPDLKQLWSSLKTRFLFDESKLSFNECPYLEPLHFHHDGCPSCDTIHYDAEVHDPPEDGTSS